MNAQTARKATATWPFVFGPAVFNVAEIRIGHSRIMLNDVMMDKGPKASPRARLPEFDPSRRSSCAVHGISDAHDVLTRCRVLPTM